MIAPHGRLGAEFNGGDGPGIVQLVLRGPLFALIMARPGLPWGKPTDMAFSAVFCVFFLSPKILCFVFCFRNDFFQLLLLFFLVVN